MFMCGRWGRVCYDMNVMVWRFGYDTNVILNGCLKIDMR